MTGDMFQKCEKCGSIWIDRDEFLSDPFVKLTGYHPNFNELETGLLLFEHSLCKNVITFEVSVFSGLYHGPVFQKPLTGSGSCPGYCLYKDNLNACKELCECAYVRSVIQIIKHYRIIFA